MVFLNRGLVAIRDFLAGQSTSSYPTYVLFGTTSQTPSVTDSSMQASMAKSFISTDVSVERQVKWEAILLSTDLTTSTIRQIGLANDSTGTSGVFYIKESVSPIVKTDQFDLQTFIIAEVVRGGEV